MVCELYISKVVENEKISARFLCLLEDDFLKIVWETIYYIKDEEHKLTLQRIAFKMIYTWLNVLISSLSRFFPFHSELRRNRKKLTLNNSGFLKYFLFYLLSHFASGTLNFLILTDIHTSLKLNNKKFKKTSLQYNTTGIRGAYIALSASNRVLPNELIKLQLKYKLTFQRTCQRYIQLSIVVSIYRNRTKVYLWEWIWQQ